MKKKIKLNSQTDVAKFTAQTLKFTGKVYVTHNEYRVDGRSLLGILSLDLSQPVWCEFEEQDSEQFDIFCGEWVAK